MSTRHQSTRGHPAPRIHRSSIACSPDHGPRAGFPIENRKSRIQNSSLVLHQSSNPVIHESWCAAVVDDEPGVRAALKLQLARLPGLEWIEDCADAQEALEVLPRLRPDLVTLDIVMPGMTGFEGVRRLRQPSHEPKGLGGREGPPLPGPLLQRRRGSDRRPPPVHGPNARLAAVGAPRDAIILVVSSVRDAGAADLAQANGANGFVLKPASSRDLQDALTAALSGQFYRPPGLLPDAGRLVSTIAPALLFPTRLTGFAFDRWRCCEDQADFWFELARAARYRVDLLARHLGRSDRQLERDWAWMFQMSPKHWLRLVRIAYVKRLLLRHRSFTAIAEEVHQESVEALRREFKACTGQTISEFLHGSGLDVPKGDARPWNVEPPLPSPSPSACARS